MRDVLSIFRLFFSTTSSAVDAVSVRNDNSDGPSVSIADMFPIIVPEIDHYASQHSLEIIGRDYYTWKAFKNVIKK